MSPSRRRRRASPAWEGRPTVTVATLPGRGLYARHLGHPEGVDAVHRPTVGPPGSPRRGAFERGWLSQHLPAVDVVHVNGPRPGQSPKDVAACADMVRASGTPLVVTGYHLSDPGGTDERRHGEQLDELVPRADAVVTLTDSAAAEMRERWDVEAHVLPHPHVVDFVRMRRGRPAYREGRVAVGLHLAGLNVPTDPVALVEALCRAVHAMEGATLVVHVHETVLDPGSSSYDPEAVRRIDRLVREAGGVLRVHRPFSDSQLWDHLFSLDVSVLPGLHGSHSVWPEACTDLGTHALVPQDTHAAGQRPCLTYDDSGGVEATADSLAKALWLAREQGPAPRADPEQRWAERVGIAESQRALYEGLLGWGR